jgi:hypothetical protein
MSAVAEELVDVDDGIEIFSRRSEAQGMRPWTRDDVLPPARHRLYRAIASEHLVLDQHNQRLPVSIEEMLASLDDHRSVPNSILRLLAEPCSSNDSR